MQQQHKLLEKRIRILLVDSQVVVRSGLRALIESRPGLEVVGEVGNQSDSITLATREQPDLILITLNEDSDLDILPELLNSSEHPRILVLTSIRDPKVHQRAVRLGATGVVLKDTPAEVLFKAINKVHLGEVWLSRSTTANVLTKLVRMNDEMDVESRKIATLTHRVREIVSLSGEGIKYKQIASRLFMSEATVRHHLTSIFDKLDVSDRLELIIYAYRYGLIKQPI
jgi:two-component system nitrate/nitrite response regulator NarL